MEKQSNYNQITNYRHFAVATQRQSEITSYLNTGYDVMNYFAKFEKFLPNSIIIRSFTSVRSQMPELDRGLFTPSPYKIGNQNTPYKLGWRQFCYFINLTSLTEGDEENRTH